MKTGIRLLTVLFCVISLLLFALPQKTVRSHAEADISVSSDAHVTRFLVLGCDRSKKLTDSMMVATINETENTLSILQIPRDTYLEYTERDYKKANGAMATLGESGIKEMLSEILGVKLHYFLVLDLDALDRLVDAVGGVDIIVERDMEYYDPAQELSIHLPAGETHLNGKQAEHFVRFRSGYANADLGRLDAQKAFMRAFAQKFSTLDAKSAVGVMLNSLTSVRTDVGVTDAIRLCLSLRRCNMESIPAATLSGAPVLGNSGASYYSINRAGAIRMVNEYLMPKIPVTEENFDPRRLLDREDHLKFHRIYTAEERELPLLD